MQDNTERCPKCGAPRQKGSSWCTHCERFIFDAPRVLPNENESRKYREDLHRRTS